MFARPEPVRPRRPAADRPDPRPLLLLFVVALAVRLGALVPVLRGAADPPPLAWLGIAGALASGAGFGSPPTAEVAPVVPWIASGMLRLGAGEAGVLAAVAAIAALAPLLAVALGGALFGGNVGRAAGWIVALDPLLVVAATTIEGVAATTGMLALAATAAWIKTPRPGRAFGAGLLWGLAALTHPALLALPPLVAGWAWVPLGLTVAPADRARQTILLLVGLAAVVAPWTARNAIATRTFAPVSTGSVRALREAHGENWRVVVPPHGARGAEVASDAAGDRRPPAQAIAGRATAFAAPGIGERGIPGAWRFAALAAGAALLVLAVWGAARVVTGPRRWFQSLALFPALAFLALALAYGGGIAARAPVEPLVAVLAAASVADLRRRLRARARGLTVVPGRG